MRVGACPSVGLLVPASFVLISQFPFFRALRRMAGLVLLLVFWVLAAERGFRRFWRSCAPRRKRINFRA